MELSLAMQQREVEEEEMKEDRISIYTEVKILNNINPESLFIKGKLNFISYQFFKSLNLFFFIYTL